MMRSKMYISKSFPTQWGATASYWAINNVTIIFAPQHTMNITYSGWFDEAAFLAGAQPMIAKTIEIPTISADPVAQQVQLGATQWLYSVLMQLPDFQDATLVS